MKTTLLRALVTFTALACLTWTTLGAAQDPFPSKPVRIIVPVLGGTMDFLARLVAPQLSEALKQPVVVENKAGAGGNIATDYVVKSKPDGYTLLIGFNGAIAINPTLFQKLPYDPVKDLAPITLAVSAPNYLVVHPSVPVSSVAEFVAYVKASTSKVSYGSIGVGSGSHLIMEMFKTAAGLDHHLVHVPYRGSAPAINDLLAGTVQAAFLVPGNVPPYMKAGRMKVLASTGRKRFPSTPDIPTMVESGFPGFEAISWIGFMAPAATPRPIVDWYQKELVRILNVPEVRNRLTAAEFEVIGSTPTEFGDFIRAEISKWGEIVKRTGAKAD